jgi:hypothetical protein
MASGDCERISHINHDTILVVAEDKESPLNSEKSGI